MGRFYLRSGLVLLMAAFCILLGVNLAGGGVEEISGATGYRTPGESRVVVPSSPPVQDELDKLKAQKEKELAKEREAERIQSAYEELKRNRADESSLFGSIGRAIGSLLSSIAGALISIFTSIFDLFI